MKPIAQDVSLSDDGFDHILRMNAKCSAKFAGRTLLQNHIERGEAG